MLATPALLGLLEACAIQLLQPSLDDGEGSVGTGAVVEHLAPTVIGRTVTISAEVTASAGRSIAFELTAREGEQLIGRCTHRRAVVDRQLFLARLDDRPPTGNAPDAH